MMIIATALTNDAEVIFSNDNKMANMADGYIDVKGLDDVQFQMSFDFPDDDQDET